MRKSYNNLDESKKIQAFVENNLQLTVNVKIITLFSIKIKLITGYKCIFLFTNMTSKTNYTYSYLELIQRGEHSCMI